MTNSVRQEWRDQLLQLFVDREHAALEERIDAWRKAALGYFQSLRSWNRRARTVRGLKTRNSFQAVLGL